MIAELKPCSAMKDSGVEWLGEVPEHWAVKRTKSVLSRNESGVWGEDPNNNGVIVLRSTEQTVSGEWNITAPARRRLTSSEYAACRLMEGDLVVTKSSGSPRHIGKTSIVTRDVEALECCFSNFMQRLRVKQNTAPRFVWYAFNGELGRRQLDYFSDTTTGLANLNSEIIGRVVLPSPPLSEQSAIVRYLDHVDRRIRRYICSKQKLITLLEEQKQALIHQAVTGRIDVLTGQPYPAYKDSGVEWLGEVPQGWQRCRLRNIVSMVTTGSRGWASYDSDTGPLFIRVANLSRGSLRLRFDDLVRLDLPITSEAGRTRIEAGDLLLSVTAYIGSVGVAPEGFEEAYVSQHVARCRPLPGMHSRWLGYVLLSTVGQTHGQMSLYGGTKDGLSLDDVKNYPILLPPQHEQEQAVRWIEGGLSGLVKIGDGAKRKIELVREYRTRLVADVVTGKLDVREAAARLPEVDPHADEFDAPIQAAETGVMAVEDTRVGRGAGNGK